MIFDLESSSGFFAPSSGFTTTVLEFSRPGIKSGETTPNFQSKVNVSKATIRTESIIISMIRPFEDFSFLFFGIGFAGSGAKTGS